MLFMAQLFHAVQDQFSVHVALPYVQLWLVIGLPPVQPLGKEFSTVRVWVLLLWQLPQLLYVKEVHVPAGGALYVQLCVVTGLPPEQPDGDELVTVRVWVLLL